jgi:hypothetical protein
MQAHTGSMKPHHAGREERWLMRWLGGTSICGVLGLACLVSAYRLGDPFVNPAHPLAVVLGGFGYFFLFNGLVIGLSGPLIWIRTRHESGE